MTSARHPSGRVRGVPPFCGLFCSLVLSVPVLTGHAQAESTPLMRAHKLSPPATPSVAFRAQGGTALAMAASTRRLVCGHETALLYSDDFGESWLPFDTQPSVDGRFITIQVSADARCIWAATYRGDLLTTHDHGRNWTHKRIVPGDGVMALAVRADGMRGLCVFGDGSIAATSDAGATWTRQLEPGTDFRLRSVAIDEKSGTAWACGSGNSFLVNPGGNSSWRPGTSKLPKSSDERVFECVYFDATNRRLLLAGWNGVALSAPSDASESWRPAYTGISNTILAIAVDREGRRGFASGPESLVLATEDGGISWYPVPIPVSGKTRGVVVDSVASRALVMGSSGSVLLQPSTKRRPVITEYSLDTRSQPAVLLLKGLVPDSSDATFDVIYRPFGSPGAEEILLQDQPFTGFAKVALQLSSFRLSPHSEIRLSVRLNTPAYAATYDLTPVTIRPRSSIAPRTRITILLLLLFVAYLIAVVWVFWKWPHWLVAFRRPITSIVSEKAPRSVFDLVSFIATAATLWLSTHARVLDAWVAFVRPKFTALFEAAEAQNAAPPTFSGAIQHRGEEKAFAGLALSQVRAQISGPFGILQIVGGTGARRVEAAASIAGTELRVGSSGVSRLPVWLSRGISSPAPPAASALEDLVNSRLHEELGEQMPDRGFVRRLLQSGRALVIAVALDEYEEQDALTTLRGEILEIQGKWPGAAVLSTSERKLVFTKEGVLIHLSANS